jgi:citrate lyase subunit alpha/citrate CoA-transferase
MGYAVADSHYADHVVVVTDTLVPFPNMPSPISSIDVDAVVVVDEIGDPSKIGTKEARITQDPRNLMMAENCAQVIASTPYFKDGFSFQTGVGGPSLAVNRFLEEYMVERNIKMGFALGGMGGNICDLMDKGLVGKLLDTQDFDMKAIPASGGSSG